jgi:tRNA-dihydrouridine synthase B
LRVLKTTRNIGLRVATMLQLGPYTTVNAVALAPMAGVTDLPFRRLCARFGAGLLVGEMVHSNPALRDSRKSRQRSTHDLELEPRSVQIVGNDPAQMAAAARFNLARGAQVIDINMGCPAKKVCRRAAGSALLADERLVGAILRAVVEAVDAPVTLKIRTGIDPAHRNGPTIARIAEDAGIALLSVHGRTRACGFTGAVEHDTTARIVEAVDIPVLANGDIRSIADARTVLEHTGAAGVMVGRAAQGAPWLPGQIAAALAGDPVPATPGAEQQFAVMAQHLKSLHAFYGEVAGPRIARKHIGWYLDGLAAIGDARRRHFNTLQTPRAQLDFLEALLSSLPTDQDLAA